MGPHKYGRYLHILTPEASDEQHGAQPWEGITGRVKHLQKQETNKIMTEMKSSNAAMNLRIDETRKAVEAKLENQLGDVQQQLKSIEAMLSLVLDKGQ